MMTTGPGAGDLNVYLSGEFRLAEWIVSLQEWGETMNVSQQVAWDVLLIGGHCTSGKSTVAHKLGRRLALPVMQVDDFRIALQQVTQPGQIEGLHFFLDPGAIRSDEPDALVKHLVRIGKIMSEAMEPVIAHHVTTKMPIIIEGDGLLPELAARMVFNGVEVHNRIRAVFVVEADEAQFKNAWQRRWPDSAKDDDSWRWRRLAWQYGQWLAQEARRLNLSVVMSSPLASLADRVSALLDVNQSL